LEDTTPL